MARVPVFSIAEPQVTLPGRTKPGPSTESLPNLQASGESPSGSVLAKSPGVTPQRSGRLGLFSSPTVTTASTSGVSKPVALGGGIFATMPSSGLPSTTSGSNNSTPLDTPKSGNAAGSSSLFSVPANGGGSASGAPRGLFGTTTQTGLPAQSSSSNTAHTGPGSVGAGLLGQKTGTAATPSSGSLSSGQGSGTTTGAPSLFASGGGSTTSASIFPGWTTNSGGATGKK
jgi:hypothetical protein